MWINSALKHIKTFVLVLLLHPKMWDVCCNVECVATSGGPYQQLHNDFRTHNNGLLCYYLYISNVTQNNGMMWSKVNRFTIDVP